MNRVQTNQALHNRARKWLDIRNHGFFRAAGVRPRLFVADPMKNAKEHVNEFKVVYDKGAQMAVAPECSITGYSMLDLFNDEVVQDNVDRAIRYILENTKEMNMVIAFGAPLIFGNSRYNCAVVAHKGVILAIIPKVHPAEGGEFEDERYFEFGGDFPENVDYLDQEDIPFGPYTVIRLHEYKHVVLTFSVCQDFWTSLPPSTVAAQKANATVGGILNASPEIVGKHEYQRSLMEVRSGADYMGLVYVSSGVEVEEGMGESTTDLTYGGRMMISHLSDILDDIDQQSDPGRRHVIHDLDIRAISQSRVTDKSFARNARSYEIPGRFREIKIHGRVGTDDEPVYYRFLHSFPRLPFVPEDPEERIAVMQTILGIKIGSASKMMQSLPRKIQKPVIAISGGSDSALALGTAAILMDTLGRPRTDIIAVTMPGFGTVDETYEIAVNLSLALGVTLYEIPITDMASLMYEMIGHDGVTEDTTFENVQAWSRKHVELALAAHYGGFVWGTGDLTELVLGNCTHYADKESNHNTNASDPKTLIYFELEMMADLIFAHEANVASYFLKAVALKPSPELKRPKHGIVVQISEDRVGPYVNQDNTMFWKLRWNRAPRTIARIQFEVFLDEMPFDEIVKWIRRFEELYLPNQFKRNTLSSGTLQGTIGASPRSKLRMPGDVSNTPWLDDIDNEIPTMEEISAVLPKY